MSWSSSFWARLQRAAITCVLLWVLVWGLRVRPLALASPPLTVSQVFVAVLLVVFVPGLAALLLLALRRPRRRPRENELERMVEVPSTWWAKLQGLLIVVAILVALALALRAGVHLVGGPTGSAGVAPTHSGVTTGTLPPSPSTAAWLPPVLLVLCLLAIPGLILGSAIQRRAHADRSVPPAPSTSRPEDPNPWKPRPGGDSREDVIAAFRMFEEDAARLGVPVDPPETAIDIAQHPVTVQAADPITIADLTALFHRARYSSDTITQADQDRAQVLLTRIRTQLGESS